ncbi:conjugative transposon protein TraN [Dyadobacter sandarakinus]|uniref:Conjugative transposon protein TraN n=1 Tax=Dyadobacter sandarakinus TaxID=2747268 RepID=A0ABX7I625_9BACT|nr:conjugative transposon protein TraN [Dyadobacter sandarakinus]QRR01554.1 conjugative transposon protein TraN [Dyadobacter sandarakinus]
MRIFLLCQLLLCPFFQMQGFCQVNGTSVIDPFPLEVTTTKTTHLIFPFGIKTVDRGSRDIIAQKATGVENILQVKAAKVDFDTTNLTVITTDGKLFSFLVGYADQPLSLNIRINSAAVDVATFGNGDLNDARVAQSALLAQRNPAHNVSVKDRSSQSELVLSSIFVDDDLLLYRIELSNNSALKYEIENLRFFVRDKKYRKRTAIQETGITLLHILGDTSAVSPQTSQTFVFVLPKMTIPNKKYLAVQVQEKNGGRHMTLKVRNRHLLKALPIRQ